MNSIPATSMPFCGEEGLVAALQRRVDAADDREFGARLLAGRAECVADLADIGRAQLEPVAGVDLDRVEKPAADELGAGDQRRRASGCTAAGDGGRRPAARNPGRRDIRPSASVVWNSRTPSPLPPRFGLRITGLPGKWRSAAATSRSLPATSTVSRRADAGGFERGVLPGLADLQVEGARLPLTMRRPCRVEPGQHRSRQLGGVAVVAGVRRRAHPVVEDAVRAAAATDRTCRDRETSRATAGSRRSSACGQRLQPGRVLVDHVDMHRDAPRRLLPR